MGWPSLLKSETFGSDTVRGNCNGEKCKSVLGKGQTQSEDVIAHLELCMQFWSPPFPRDIKEAKKFEGGQGDGDVEQRLCDK